MPARLTDSDLARVHAEHPIVDVLARYGISAPKRKDDSRDFMISCPCSGHDDSTPSCVVHPQTDRWYCFGCGRHGDVFDLVREIEHVSSLAKIAQILDGHRPITKPLARPAGGAIAVDPHAVRAGVPDRPDPSRTPHARVLAANAAAWAYLTVPKLARQGRDYLASRRIEVRALEAETRERVVGHTPRRLDGLVTNLRAHGFDDSEIIDAGWGVHGRDGQLIDRFRHRVIIPVGDRDWQIIGVYGRDPAGASPKYLNTPETVAFHKGAALYRPTARPLDPHASVVICEGSRDALAIAAAAATAGTSRSFAPVSPSGTALTTVQAALVLAINRRPPVVCAAGDSPGITAAAKWARALMRHGRETLITALPDGHDPASWLSEHGPEGLTAFSRPGCLTLPDDVIKPVPAGALLAQRILEQHAPGRGSVTDLATLLPNVIGELASHALNAPDTAAAQRFATAAGNTLASRIRGLNADDLAQQLLTAINRQTEAKLAEWLPAADIHHADPDRSLT